MTQCFSGIRVLDFSQVLAGPFAANQLALLGADVIKVEPPEGGDQMRDRMLPSAFASVGMASSFMTLNLGKRSLALDVKDPRGKAIAMALVARADVVLHNFRAGVVDRLGLDYASVAALNPGVVWCSISGFGNEGPRAADAAYDGAIQAASGMMANNGHASTGPTRTGYFPVDMMTGMTAAFAIAGALLRRERTGEGQALDVAMMDAALTLQASAFAQCLVDGNPGGLIGNSSATGLPTADSFPTAQGVLLMSATMPGHVAAIFEEMGLGDPAGDPRFATPAARAANRVALRDLLCERFATDTAASWATRLARRGVPVSRVNAIADALAEPQLAHRTVLVDVPAPAGVGRPVRLVGAAFKASADGPRAAGPPPALGEHSASVLAELGYDDAQVAALVAEGVVRLGPAGKATPVE